MMVRRLRSALFVLLSGLLSGLARRVARRSRNRNVLLHPRGLRNPPVRTRIVADTLSTPLDVRIAARLLAAYRTAGSATNAGDTRDHLRTPIAASLRRFIWLPQR